MEKIWLKTYMQGVPAEINPDSYGSLADLFTQCCQKFADKPAFSNMGTVISFRELEKLATDFAAYLQHKLGLRQGDRIALMMPNILQYPVAMFGALKAGLIVVNVNPLYTARELVQQLSNAEADAIVILENFTSVLQEALSQVSVKNIIVTQFGDLFPYPKALLINFVLKYIKKMVPAWNIPQAIPFKSALKQGAQIKFTPYEIKGSDIAFLQYTGGTTGVAKGAELSHRNLLANIMQIYAWTDHLTEEGEEIIITALPLYHIFSLTANCLTFFKLGAHNVLVTNPRDIPQFVKLLKKVPFTIMTGVNTLFNALLNNPEFHQVDFKHLRFVIGGGMAVQQAVAERWQRVTGVPILEGYGLTEASPVVCVNPLNVQAHNGSIGLPLPSTEVKICDEAGNELPLGEIGELWIKAPQVMRGYWRAPEETQKILTAEGWLLTGDMAKLDQAGFVYLVERKKDLIIVSGFNVYPTEIEDILAKHPGVLEAAVIGVPSSNTGEAVKAFIVKKDPTLSEEDIIAFCRKQLTAYKVPKQIEFREELPKSNVGKVLRRKLRE
ncbi:MAG: long-chain acyl-CoA synthetase [Gammaproteobacteria bacterium]|jgi:long-chain acyl-CoA synthetase|nr:long-chain acyl-CoA synthetase [Gammaproteobacteria bacterium]